MFKTFKKKKKKIENCTCKKRERERGRKKERARVAFFLWTQKYTEKNVRQRAATIRLHVDTMCNFIICFCLESHAARKISNWFPLSFTANSWHAGRNLMNFRECKVSAESRELAFSLPVPFLKRRKLSVHFSLLFYFFAL